METRTNAPRVSPFVNASRFGKVNLAGTSPLQTIDTEVTMSKTLPETEVDDGFEDEEPAPNSVRIGKKPTMHSVVAYVSMLNTGVTEVMVSARCQSISKAGELVEMVMRAFSKNVHR